MIKPLNIAFLIGNGFDVNAGLKTRYTDILAKYLRLESVDPRIVSFKEEIDRNIEYWSDFEKRMGDYAKYFDGSNLDEMIDNYQFCINDFSRNMVLFLKKQEARVNLKGKENLISEAFKKSIIDFYLLLENNPKRIITNMISNIGFIRYSCISFNYTNALEKCYEIFKSDHTILKYMSQKMQAAHKSISYGSSNFLGQVFYIHGTLGNNFVLGVDNQAQIMHEGFRSDSRITDSFIKPQANKFLGNGNNSNVENVINSADIFCIYGMSIGETDKTWWKKIAENLKTYGNKQLVIFVWDPKFSTNLAAERINFIRNKRDGFLKVADCQNENSISDRIHIVINNKEMFNVNLVDKESSHA
jgi:hypothetical protein